MVISFLLAGLTATAGTAQNDGVITVRTSRAAKALVQKWVDAYKSVRPDVRIEIVSGKTKDADLTLTSSKAEGEPVTFVGRYALLPVTPAANPLKDDIQKKTWSAKDLKRLFFTDEDIDDEIDGYKSKKEQLGDKLTVFTGSHSLSWTPALAAHFGHTIDDVKGNKVAGDDYYLLNAIEQEPQSVTFTSLTFLYDHNTRTIRNDIEVLPLNVKAEQSKALGNLDATLNVLEHQRIDAIPVEHIGFAYQTLDSDIDQFLKWVISEGQQYNHQEGFLTLR